MGRRRQRKEPTREQRQGISPRLELGLATLLLALAALARGWQLGRAPLWLDEAMSWRFARLPLAELADALRLDSGPPLYYLLLRGWTALAGDGTLALRVPSALAGVALVGAIWRIGRHHFGPGIGLTAAAVAALSPVAVAFSREARVYPMLSLASLLAVHLAVRWIGSRQTSDLLGASLATVAALYFHNYAVLLLLVLATLPWLSSSVPHRRRIQDGAILAAPAIALLPWLPIFAEQTRAGAPTAWMAAAWEAHGGVPGVLAASLASLSPGGAQPPYVGIRGLSTAGWLPSALALVALAIGTVALARSRIPAGRPVHGRWLLAYLALPPALAAAISLLRSPIYLPGRLDQLVLPAFCCTAAVGWARLRPRGLALLVGAGWLSLSAATLFAALRVGPLPEESGLPIAVRQRVRPGDTVVCTSLTRAPLEHALRRVNGLAWRSYPDSIARHPGNVDTDALLARPEELRREADALVTSLSGRVLVAFVPDAVDRFLFERLVASPRARETKNVGTYRLPRLGLEVTLFALDLGPSPP